MRGRRVRGIRQRGACRPVPAAATSPRYGGACELLRACRGRHFEARDEVGQDRLLQAPAASNRRPRRRFASAALARRRASLAARPGGIGWRRGLPPSLPDEERRLRRLEVDVAPLETTRRLPCRARNRGRPEARHVLRCHRGQARRRVSSDRLGGDRRERDDGERGRPPRMPPRLLGVRNTRSTRRTRCPET